MGILESLRYSTGNPDRDAQLNRGLLEMGLALMQSKGPLSNALGQAGMVGLQAADRTRQSQAQTQAQELQRQMQRLQLGSAQREADIAALPQKFYRAPSAPAIDPTGGMETAVEAPNNASGPGGFDMQGYAQALMAHSPQQGLALKQMLKEPEVKPLVSKPGDVARDPRTGAVLWQNPEAADGEKDAFLRVMKAAGIDPVSDQGRKLLANYLTKQATHAPPVSIQNYGTPLPVQLPGGGTGYLAPPTGPGRPSALLTIPGSGEPAKRPDGAEKEPTEAERKAATLLSRMRFSQQQLSEAVRASPSAASPGAGAEAARRVGGDTAANIVNPAERQRVEAAQLDILDAALTLGTGAAYTREQLEGYRRAYFPQLGDDEATVADKQRRLQNVIQAAEVAAGRAANRIATKPADQPGADPLGLRGGR